MEQRKRIPIGIDLGTAYTRVAVFTGNQWEMIPDDSGNSAMPSYVAFTDSGVLVGQPARMQAPQNPTNTIFGQLSLIIYLFIYFSFIHFNLQLVKFDSNSYPKRFYIYANV
jgi:molecular chaperone DnaK (HSP70)